MLIDFYSRYPRWLFRTTDRQCLAPHGRNACRSTIGSDGRPVAERQLIDVAHFHKERFHELFDEWQQAVQVEYDAWMDQRYVQGPASSVTLKRGRVVFDLDHGAVYEVRGKDGSGRIFRVQLANDFPYVSFRDTASGVDYPWVGLPDVFTQAELMTLRRMY